MTYQTFTVHSYSFAADTGEATFRYSFDDERKFTERVIFTTTSEYDEDVLNNALFMASVIAGISYYKSFPTRDIRVEGRELTREQVAFFSEVYKDGLSQFVYENDLSPEAIGSFSGDAASASTNYDGQGMMIMQSGGKDSLLLARLLEKEPGAALYHVSQGNSYPAVLNALAQPLVTAERIIDRVALKQATQDGGLNGHIPITFVMHSYALVQAVLHGKNTVLAAIGQEGEEPYAHIGDYAIRHQWAKTWRAEELFASYIASEISPQIRVGSPLRGWSELKIAREFVQHCWSDFAHSFSSCNIGNYKQGHDTSKLTWCGECPKCANSYLLFSAYVEPDELIAVFGEDLYQKPSLIDTFKGLLEVEGVEKPFECVGERDELRKAYELAQARGHSKLPFDVPASDFDVERQSPSQRWALQMIQ